MVIKHGEANKNGDQLTVEFGHRFKELPTVVVSPYSRGSSGAVGSIETITSVTHTEFVVVSGNKGNTHFVSWIAVGDD
jgi:hypothetical protein